MKLEPLDDDLRALLDHAKEIPELDAATKATLLASVTARLPSPGGGGGGGPSSGGDLLARGKRSLAFLATFAVGLGTGVLVAQRPAPPPPPPPAPVVVAQPTLPVALPAPPEPTLVIEVADPPPVLSAPPAPAPAVSARGLAAERALLDVARTELARGAPDAALVAAERHARTYPSGVLVEEREALAIRALVALGRRDDARARAVRFEQSFPNGVMLRAVKGALGE